MTVDIANRQRAMKVDVEEVRLRADRILAWLEVAESELSVALVSDRGIRSLNKRFRQIDKATDVLSFEAGGVSGGGVDGVPLLLGDVVISVERADSQAVDRRLELGQDGYGLLEEITFLLIHGVLHLLGYDHENTADALRMEKVEGRLFREFSPLAARDRHE